MGNDVLKGAGKTGAAPIITINSHRVYVVDGAVALPPKDAFLLTVDQLNLIFPHEDHRQALVEILCRSVRFCLKINK